MRRALILSVLTIALVPCGCKVSRPNAVERKTVTFVKHHITVRNKSAKNPLAITPHSLTDGKEAFGHYCVACHGRDGQNTGVPFADNMSPPLPPLTSPEVQQYTDGQLKWVIDNGIWPSGMPASKGTLSDDEIWSIVLYLRHLPLAGSVGEPEMYTH
ncbi:MAG: cytochrome c [Acidobacteriota bacterium]